MFSWTKYVTLFSLSLAGLATVAQAGPISAVVVYGDSLSDNGNLYAASGGTFPPSPPYFPGRRSNGPVAVEQLAADLGAPLIDYAWIGATTGVGNLSDHGTPTTFGTQNLPGLTTQFALTQTGLGSLLSSGLFVVWGGPNDFLSPSPLDSTPQAIATRAVADIVSIVTGLKTLGANNILVPGLPDLGLTPSYRAQGLLAAAQASALTDAFNALLLADLPSGVTYFDTAGYLRGIVANPAAYGFTDVTDACFDGVTVCGNPGQYLFFDDFHPTAAANTLLGNAFAAAAVPEPSTVMLSGIALCLLVGWQKRRLQRA